MHIGRQQVTTQYSSILQIPDTYTGDAVEHQGLGSAWPGPTAAKLWEVDGVFVSSQPLK